MANETFTLIATTTLAATSATITFNAIPALGTDLVLLLSAKTTGTGSPITMTLNGVGATSSNYVLNGNNAVSASSTQAGIGFDGVFSGAVANTFHEYKVYITDYLSSVTKRALSEAVVTGSGTTADTAAISIFASTYATATPVTTLVVTTGSFQINTVASLYYIKQGSGGATVA